MTDRTGENPPSRIDAVADAVALIGGVLLIALATMVVVSVTLRSDLVGKAGVPGDFELVQMATAVAAFCFLPLCQLKRGNIFVDTFTLKLPQRWWACGARPSHSMGSVARACAALASMRQRPATNSRYSYGVSRS